MNTIGAAKRLRSPHRGAMFWQMVAMGIVVVAAVYLDTLRKKIR